MRVSLRSFSAAGIGVVLSASVALAQSVPTWGSTDESLEFISAWDMSAFDSTTTWQGDPVTGFRYLTVEGSFFGGLHIPNGAVIDSIELDACDTSTSGQVDAGIVKSTGGGFGDILGSVVTGPVSADGCSRWTHVLEAPETVDAQTYDYYAYEVNDTFDGSTLFGGLRVYYHLQVSPAPLGATFGDVATDHPFFQFVEALVASGITAGCGNGNFCPDAPLTRGQMAVFLSKAIGLHWPVASGSN